jgi:hypothetical protein
VVTYSSAVVAEHPDGGAGLRHRADLAEPFSVEPYRHRADRAHRHVAVLRTERGDLFHDPGGVLHRARVRHGVDRRESARRRRA